MHYIVDTSKSVDHACRDLEAAVTEHEFGVLHVHDLRATLQSKGVNFPHECRIFEVCNPQLAARVLADDMTMNMALPCRISVWEDDSRSWIGMIRPAPLMEGLSASPSLKQLAAEVEATTKAIIDAAR